MDSTSTPPSSINRLSNLFRVAAYLLFSIALLAATGLMVSRTSSLAQTNRSLRSNLEQLSQPQRHDFGRTELLAGSDYEIIEERALDQPASAVVAIVTGAPEWKQAVAPWSGTIERDDRRPRIQLVIALVVSNAALESEVLEYLRALPISFRLLRVRNVPAFAARSALKFVPTSLVLSADHSVRAIAVGMISGEAASRAVGAISGAASGTIVQIASGGIGIRDLSAVSAFLIPQTK